MSDSVDRVFVHALATVRRLPRTGSSRPPPSARLRLYGLYKQSMEGDVSAILPRPTLPIQSPNPNDPLLNNPVQRYASRDLRTKETQAEMEKWDAWHACAGMTRTEAKRRYISTLIDTMKEYASGTTESRELVSELEFVWNQIKSQSGSDESESGESPTRKLERSGMKRAEFIDPPGPGRGSSSTNDTKDKDKKKGGGRGLFGFGRIQRSTTNDSSSHLSRRQSQSAAASGLRVLSPKSPRFTDEIVENEELAQVPPDAEPNSDDDEQVVERGEGEDAEEEQYEEGETEDSRNQDQDQANNEMDLYNSNQQIPNSHSNPSDTIHWRTQMEAHLSRLTLELTALREQLSSHSLLSRSSFSHLLHPSSTTFLASMPWHTRTLHRLTTWLRWTLYTLFKQFAIQLALLTVVVVYGRWRGDRRVEMWVRLKVNDFQTWASSWNRRRWGLRAF